jgi:hypothetical protein
MERRSGRLAATVVTCLVSCGQPEPVGRARVALTGDECMQSALGGKDAVCHRTFGSPPYVRIVVAEQACIQAHATSHPEDFIDTTGDCSCVGNDQACQPAAPCCSGTCIGGVCKDLCAGVVCAPLDACHVAGTCDPWTGACSSPAAPDGTSCDDGNACTRADSCLAGVCTGADPVTCRPIDQCHLAGTCNPSTGLCSKPVAPSGTPCDDGRSCTHDDTCQAGTLAGTCSGIPVADGTACDDTNACTVGDSCSKGVCVGGGPALDGTACSDGAGCAPTAACQSGACAEPGSLTCEADRELAPSSFGTCCQEPGACSFGVNPDCAVSSCCQFAARPGAPADELSCCSSAKAVFYRHCTGPVTCPPGGGTYPNCTGTAVCDCDPKDTDCIQAGKSYPCGHSCCANCIDASGAVVDSARPLGPYGCANCPNLRDRLYPNSSWASCPVHWDGATCQIVAP